MLITALHSDATRPSQRRPAVGATLPKSLQHDDDDADEVEDEDS